MHVVLINGPAGAGKNTIATMLKHKLHELIRADITSVRLKREGISAIGIEEHKQPLIDMLFAFAESISEIEMGAARTPTLYESLKDRVMLGATGREWQIIWSTGMKGRNPNVFIDFVHTKARNMKLDVLIAPDCGFFEEYQAATRKAGQNNVTLIYLDGWKRGVPVYKHGDQFQNDSRMCLRGLAHLENPSPEEAAQYVFRSLRLEADQHAINF